jgi:hypothetical protein
MNKHEYLISRRSFVLHPQLETYVKTTYIDQMDGSSDAIVTNHAYLCSFRVRRLARADSTPTVTLALSPFLWRSWPTDPQSGRCFVRRSLCPFSKSPQFSPKSRFPMTSDTGLARQVRPCAQRSCGVHVSHKEE